MPSKKKSTTATKLPSSSTPSNTKKTDKQSNSVPLVNEPDDVQKETHRQEEEQEVAPDSKHGTDTPRSSRSWYGPWGKKSRESISLDSSSQLEHSTADSKSEAVKSDAQKGVALPRDIPAKRKPLLSPGSSVRSLPLAATITKLNISSETSSKAQEPENTGSNSSGKDGPQPRDPDPSEPTKIPDSELDNADTAKSDNPSITATPTSWLSWGRGERPFLPSIMPNKTSSTDTTTHEQATLPTNAEAVNSEAVDSKPPQLTISKDSSGKPEDAVPSAWYSRWTFGAGNASGMPKSTDSNVTQDSSSVNTHPPVTQTANILSGSNVDTKKSGWTFWSSSTSQGDNASGQLAVADSSSQSKPEPAVVQEGLPVPPSDDRKKRPLSQGDEPVKKKQAPSTTDHIKKVEEKLVKERPNILLPTFESTYPSQISASSIWQQIGSWIYPNHNTKHLVSIKEPRKIKHALAIGVHGYFPGTIVQTVLGKPTGTSIKFADSAAKAIEDFTQKHGYSPQSIDKIALEGEGRIDERLEILWKLLLNWIDLIRKADFILVACHSQGVPVAISLVAKLIGFGCVSEARIGICAMAGVSRGPFLEYKSRWIGGSAAELFEFSDPNSSVSQSYRGSLATVLRFGVKVVFIGSLDDQLVPLHSSTFTHVNHPNIYRAVFVDGRIHVADFISHLVGFALKLRNLNTSDHGLIKELSSPLAGSLVGGEGHSRIYDEPAVYNLAMDFTLRTSDVVGAFESDDTPIPTTTNPFILPFAMRGVLEEDIVRQELSNEVIELLKQFDHWKPVTKVLRDVKYRLEGVRSKL